MKTLRRLALVSLVVLGLPLAAQPGPPGGGPGGPGGPPPDYVLKEVLGLSTDQLNALQKLLQARGQAIQALQKQLGDAQKALGDAAGAASPDPATVGKAFLAIQAIQKQIGQAHDAAQANFHTILNADQQAKVAAIRALQLQLAAGGALAQLGL